MQLRDVRKLIRFAAPRLRLSEWTITARWAKSSDLPELSEKDGDLYAVVFVYRQQKHADIMLRKLGDYTENMPACPLGEVVLHELLHLLIPSAPKENDQLEFAVNTLSTALWTAWEYEWSKDAG